MIGRAARRPGGLAGALLLIVLLALSVATAAAGFADGAYLPPAILLALVLLAARRYPGERALTAVLMRPRRPARRADTARRSPPRPACRRRPRGGELIAACLAERPPPAFPLPSH